MSNIRNFWIETKADGAQTTQATGPRSKRDGFTTTIYINDNGGVLRAVEISGRVISGELVIEVIPAGEARSKVHGSKAGFTVTTKRDAS